MAFRIIAIQTLLCLVSYTLGQQACFDSFVVVPARTASCATPGVTPGPGTTGEGETTCLVRNPPVARRDDYTYFPGIGGYKLHSKAVSWNQARFICEEEGGHLAIINSWAERDAVVTVLKATNPHPDYVSLGFHDLCREGHHITIHEETLANAGFDEWAKGEPNNKYGSENCGSLHSSGGLNDHRCEESLPFMCEHPIH
ncbi:hemolymph lipopolysaccharide-binding protein-like [Neodiprion lecontei]|uniref:Hemolymph lipopolysaccharide-binding protein-like n=1 Tax=Neodiprion lecontei TaxID=441921 RepID=A0ABM3GK32_NEOLC|nr:hemolymph lipopolysaccharide-binding protein-like [Neodiprion lecontei]